MAQELLNEREFELINIIGSQLAQSQRDLSRQMQMSLGMTNMLLRRLVTKGYIRITQLNKKKVQYLLTSKGFTEKMRKSIKYTLKTIDSIGLVKRGLIALFQSSLCLGVQKFYILGGVDLADLIELTLREQFGPTVELVRIDTLNISMNDGIILNCREEMLVKGFESLRMVNVIRTLAGHQQQAVLNEN